MHCQSVCPVPSLSLLTMRRRGRNHQTPSPPPSTKTVAGVTAPLGQSTEIQSCRSLALSGIVKTDNRIYTGFLNSISGFGENPILTSLNPNINVFNDHLNCPKVMSGCRSCDSMEMCIIKIMIIIATVVLCCVNTGSGSSTARLQVMQSPWLPSCMLKRSSCRSWRTLWCLRSVVPTMRLN